MSPNGGIHAAALQAAIDMACPPQSAEGLCTLALTGVVAAMRGTLGSAPPLRALSAVLQGGGAFATGLEGYVHNTPTAAAREAHPSHFGSGTQPAPSPQQAQDVFPHPHALSTVRQLALKVPRRQSAPIALIVVMHIVVMHSVDHSCTDRTRSAAHAGASSSGANHRRRPEQQL